MNGRILISRPVTRSCAFARCACVRSRAISSTRRTFDALSASSSYVTGNHQIKVGIQAVNLLNEVTKTLQAYTGDPHSLAPRSYFMNDRRYSFIVRGSF